MLELIGPGGATAPHRGNTMPKTGTIFAILTLFTLTFAGCMTMSDEERCKKEGGVWNNKMCERQAK